MSDFTTTTTTPTEFTTIMEANTKPAKTLRKAKPEPEELTFLDKVRDVRLSLMDNMPTLVVVDWMRSFEQIFSNFSPAMKLYSRNGLLSIKTVDMVSAEDLEMNIIEIDKR